MNFHQLLQAFLTLTIWGGLRVKLRAMKIAKWKENIANGFAAFAALAILARIVWYLIYGN